MNYNNSPKKSGTKFLHSDVKDSLPVISKVWLQLSLPRVARPGIRFMEQLLFRAWLVWIAFLMNEWKIHFVFSQVIFDIQICLMIWNMQVWQKKHFNNFSQHWSYSCTIGTNDKWQLLCDSELVTVVHFCPQKRNTAVTNLPSILSSPDSQEINLCQMLVPERASLWKHNKGHQILSNSHYHHKTTHRLIFAGIQYFICSVNWRPSPCTSRSHNTSPLIGRLISCSFPDTRQPCWGHSTSWASVSGLVKQPSWPLTLWVNSLSHAQRTQATKQTDRGRSGTGPASGTQFSFLNISCQSSSVNNPPQCV